MSMRSVVNGTSHQKRFSGLILQNRERIYYFQLHYLFHSSEGAHSFFETYKNMLQEIGENSVEII